MQNSRFSGSMVGVSLILSCALSIAAIAATFFVSVSDLTLSTKTWIFVALAFLYLTVFSAFYFRQKNLTEPRSAPENTFFSDGVEGKLLALEEAGTFFGASLKTDDMFRLAASRINEIISFDSCVMFVPSDEESFLKIKFAAGENAAEFSDFTADISRCLAAKVLFSGKAQVEEDFMFDRVIFPPEISQNLGSAIAAPLFHEGEVFAVLTLYAREKNYYDEKSLALVEAVAERVTPLFAGSMAFERSISNALTDTLTALPNERAFYLVLENQVAESHRYRDERPLTVLAIDIRDFDELNRKFGHATGDQVLAYAAAAIKKQLRQMDVLARARGDEFLAVLPKASEKMAQEVIDRIKRAFILNPFELTKTEKIHFQLNFGAATFWRDGETANQLLQTARLKKTQDKSGEKSKVLWFPKEFVN